MAAAEVLGQEQQLLLEDPVEAVVPEVEAVMLLLEPEDQEPQVKDMPEVTEEQAQVMTVTGLAAAAVVLEV